MEETKKVEKQEFREIVKGILPHIECIQKALEDRRIDTLTSITLSADGYIDAKLYDTGRGMVRISGGETRIKYTEGL